MHIIYKSRHGSTLVSIVYTRCENFGVFTFAQYSIQTADTARQLLFCCLCTVNIPFFFLLNSIKKKNIDPLLIPKQRRTKYDFVALQSLYSTVGLHISWRTLLLHSVQFLRGCHTKKK